MNIQVQSDTSEVLIYEKNDHVSSSGFTKVKLYREPGDLRSISKLYREPLSCRQREARATRHLINV